MSVNIEVGSFLITSLLLALDLIKTYYVIRTKNQFENIWHRLAILVVLSIVFLFTIYLVVSPVEIFLFISIIYTFIVILYWISLIRHKDRTSLLIQNRHAKEVSQIYRTEVKYIGIVLESILINVEYFHNLDNIKKSLRQSISNIIHNVFRTILAENLDVSILKVLQNGRFETLASNDHRIGVKELDRMKTKFDKHEPSGVAGHCLHSGKAILEPDLRDEEVRDRIKYVNIHEDHSFGGIICIPVIYPRGLQRDGVNNDEYLGVLCISCTQPNKLNQDHLDLLVALFIDIIACAMLAHELNYKLKQYRKSHKGL